MRKKSRKNESLNNVTSEGKTQTAKRQTDRRRKLKGGLKNGLIDCGSNDIFPHEKITLRSDFLSVGEFPMLKSCAFR